MAASSLPIGFSHTRQLLRILLVLALCLLLTEKLRGQASLAGDSLSAAPAAAPKLIFTHIPPWNSQTDTYLQGQALNVNAANYQVTFVILVEGLGWYSKPYCDSGNVHAIPVSLDSNGNWSANMVTYYLDASAIKIAAYLIPKSYTPPCTYAGGGLPQAVAANAVASLLVNRPNPKGRHIKFSGYTWWIKSNPNPIQLYPGPNNFSDSTRNVWVDSTGYLHLKITSDNGTWHVPEIVSQNVLGFGTNTWVLGSAVDALDPNVVLGLFTWSDTDSSYSNREIDVEFSKFGNAGNRNNAAYSVQPTTFPFLMPSGVPQSTSILQWQPNLTYFETYNGTDPNQTIAQWTYPNASDPPGDQNVRMNLWLLGGAPPTNGQEVEVVIQSYSFAPYLGPATLGMSPKTVVGGASSTGTVTLYNAAPTGGTTLNLSSNNNSVVSLPPTVSIAAGSKTGRFTAMTSAVSQLTTVTITASGNGGSASATLTVKP